MMIARPKTMKAMKKTLVPAFVGAVRLKKAAAPAPKAMKATKAMKPRKKELFCSLVRAARARPATCLCYSMGKWRVLRFFICVRGARARPATCLQGRVRALEPTDGEPTKKRTRGCGRVVSGPRRTAAGATGTHCFGRPHASRL